MVWYVCECVEQCRYPEAAAAVTARVGVKVGIEVLSLMYVESFAMSSDGEE